MRLGKLTNEELETHVLSYFTPCRKEPVLRPQAGVDCAALDLGDNLCVLSCDPITSAGAALGALAVHVSCNDAAAAGAEPVGLMVTLLSPPDAALSDIERFAKELAKACKDVNVEVLGGHTEFTDSVTRMIAIVTVVAKAPKNGLITPAGMKAGDALIMTKWAGLEGTAIIAEDYAHLLGGVPQDVLEQARMLGDCLSVLSEGRIAARLGAHAMHDITEGGVIAAAGEMAEASGCAVRLCKEDIPVLDATKEICARLGLDPLRLLSSGCMLIACDNAEELLAALEAGGIPAKKVGEAAEGEGVYLNGARVYALARDEIYNIG